MRTRLIPLALLALSGAALAAPPPPAPGAPPPPPGAGAATATATATAGAKAELPKDLPFKVPDGAEVLTVANTAEGKSRNAAIDLKFSTPTEDLAKRFEANLKSSGFEVTTTRAGGMISLAGIKGNDNVAVTLTPGDGTRINIAWSHEG